MPLACFTLSNLARRRASYETRQMHNTVCTGGQSNIWFDVKKKTIIKQNAVLYVVHKY